MSVETINLSERAVLARAAAANDLSVHDLALLRQSEIRNSSIDARSPSEKDHDSAVVRAQGNALKIARKAAAYLFGAIDTHWVEFHVGHGFKESRDAHSIQHSTYLEHLQEFVVQDVIHFDEQAGLYLHAASGRGIQRQQLFVDAQTLEPGLVRYVGTNMEPIASLGAQEDAMRLIAKA